MALTCIFVWEGVARYAAAFHLEATWLRTKRYNATGSVVSGTGGVCDLYSPRTRPPPSAGLWRLSAPLTCFGAPGAVTQLSTPGAGPAGTVVGSSGDTDCRPTERDAMTATAAATTTTARRRTRTGGPGDRAKLLENLLGWTLVVVIAMFVTQLGLM